MNSYFFLLYPSALPIKKKNTKKQNKNIKAAKNQKPKLITSNGKEIKTHTKLEKKICDSTNLAK